MLALLVQALLLAPGAWAQTEAGRPVVRPFEAEWPSDTQASDIAQGRDGRIYVVSGHGLLIYDGVRWDRVRLLDQGNPKLHSVDVSNGGRVWVGAEGEWGYFEPDSVGALAYVSVTDRVPALARPLQRVIGVTAVGGSVYALSGGYLLRWQRATGVRAWPVSEGASVSEVRGALYLADPARGLLRLDGEQLRAVPGGDRFAGVEASVHESPRGLVVVTASGLWRYRGGTFVPVPTEADGFLRDVVARPRGTRRVRGGIGIPTLLGGLVVLNDDDTVRAVVGREARLPDPSALSLLEARDGTLWIGTGRGVVRVSALEMTRFDDQAGLDGAVLGIARHQGRLYAATSTGLFRLQRSPSAVAAATLVRVAGMTDLCSDVLSTAEGLLVACRSGLYRLGERAEAIAGVDGPSALARGASSARAWVGTKDGAVVPLRFEGGRWTAGAPVWNGGAIVQSVHEEPDGTLWASLDKGIVARVRRTGSAWTAEVWGDEGGLVGTNWAYLWRIGGRLAVGTKSGLFRFHKGQTPAFALDADLGTFLVGQARDFPNVFRLAEGPQGFWVYGGDEAGVVQRRGGRYILDRTPLQGVQSLGTFYALVAEADGTVWFGGAPGLFRRAPGPLRPVREATATIHRVSAVDVDSVLWGGFGAPRGPLLLEPSLNALRFEFGAPGHSGSAPPRFRYRLRPLETGWSAWTEADAKEYTNIPPGDYTFDVQAETDDGRAAQTRAFHVRIEPPWYGTVWARIGLGLLVLAALAGLAATVARIQRKHLAAERAQLAQAVAERTAEVEAQKAQLAAQTEQLRALDRSKNAFFANVSHEFRTPLTLTLGPLDDVLAGEYGPVSDEAAAPLGLARRSAGRVLDLIGQILDLSRLEAGSTPLRARPLDLSAFAQAQAEAFGPLATHRRIALSVVASEAPAEVWADPEHVATILSNVLSNALKFTPEGGRVTVRVTAETDRVRVSVDDTGSGIGAADLPRVFDRFYQVESSADRPLGTGIGLALAHDLARLHGGTLTAESTAGEGSTFTLALQTGRAHLAPHHIHDEPYDGTRGATPTTEAPVTEARTVEMRASAPVQPGDSEGDLDDDRTTVLVADDNADIRAYVRRHLEAAGYRVDEAEDGEAALDRVRERLPDLVVSDVMMPRLDGFGLCRALRASPDTDFVPILLLTAKAAPEDRLDGLAEACDDYLTKPFDVRELVARVGNLIALRQRLRDRYSGDGAPRRSARAEAAATAATEALPTPPSASADDAFVAAVRDAIEARLGDDAFDVGALAEAVGQSRRSLLRSTTALLDAAPSDLIRTARLDRAAHLLQTDAGAIGEIAYAVGFRSVSHFSNAFLAHTGVRPSAYVEA